MNDTQAKYPQLRFKGFADPWEQCKLGDVAKITMGQSPNSKNYTDNPKDHILVQGNADMKDGQVHPRIWTTEITKIADKGDLILSVRAPVGDIGKTSYDVVIGRGVAAIKGNEFIFQLLKRMKTVGYWTKYSTGSTFESINSLEINNAVINLPKEHEQNKVGKILSYMDHAITLHEEKKRQLERLKSALLQKMFADKNGYPAVRFEGFSDEWEERKLSDLFIKGGSGGTPKSTNKDFYDGDIPFLGISDITKSNGFINNTEKHISSDGLNSSAAWIVSKGAISLAMYASVGKLAILNIDAATSQAFYNMIFDDYDLRDLVYQRLNKANELSEWNKLISTGTQSNLNADKVKNFQMYLPKNHDEIKLISTFFKKIDNAIALHQRKLDLLKEQKKGFLQKMFV
ncbi:restriction endonuclease subunit S (plasmid) [Lactobacillus delbrueckii subsp. lactis]|uniref:restriction endonuclease subunit S n=3 Tax=Lactobacillus delbrueckii TaxID=1584 RepID=UPI001A98581D|nr:restriction endonuclease subunit S [Lactobacillus delbrueckii]MBO1170621.1 restriction endonuclease subunit S [Lactobacillus delbrueckii subsp. lactis]MBO1181023.1 restriction endonuclease subunit S [Lactobacillus delbrueckii subsp. lactis]MBO1182855.1 restriction endonuclease subunit S [Lactobacillus delbrueckii subsp. lactis]MBO1184676.1 restriction endonuclease subunit S [Lactobacillus delbrueckii subsp. lactis]MBO1188184.1 restriction endonuclease subunit S [Lactobacillus delbrueckii su